MSLKIYERDIDKKHRLYIDGSVFNISHLASSYNAFRVYHTPTGAVVTRRMFLRNDELTKYYTDVTIRPGGIITTSSGDAPYYIQEESPLLLKLHKGWLQPDTITWQKKAAFNRIMWDKIGDKNIPDRQYYPFWLAIEFVGLENGKIVNELSNTNLQLVITSQEFSHGKAQYKRYFK